MVGAFQTTYYIKFAGFQSDCLPRMVSDNIKHFAFDRTTDWDQVLGPGSTLVALRSNSNRFVRSS